MISKLFIDNAVSQSPLVHSFQKNLNIPFEYIDNINDVYKIIDASEDPVAEGKKNLVLTKNKGAFIKKCPGTSCYTCCDYKILHIGTFCFMDCSYCILQAYFHPPVLQFFVNTDDLFMELDKLFLAPEITRIGTGEYTDSLIWDHWTNISPQLIDRFSKQKRAVLELKTKTVAVSKLEKISHNQKTIMAWSLNTERVIRNNERNTSSLDARIRAASQCEAWGYPLAFHFDPIVIYEGCIDEYRSVVEKLLTTVSPESIAYISLGSFRFIPSLKKIIQQRFEESDIVYGEFIQGLDGKMRYFKPLRIKVYKAIYEAIRSFSPDVFVYYCMEDSEVWEKTMGFFHIQQGGLGQRLDERVKQHCRLEI